MRSTGPHNQVHFPDAVAQTSRFDLFGLVLLVATALIHPELIVRDLSQ